MAGFGPARQPGRTATRRKGSIVADVLYVVITVAFFAACVGLVRACDSLLGPDELDETEVTS